MGSHASLVLSCLYVSSSPPTAIPRARAGTGAARHVVAALRADRSSNLAAISPFRLSQLVVLLTNDVCSASNGRKNMTYGSYFAAKRVIRNQSVIII